MTESDRFIPSDVLLSNGCVLDLDQAALIQIEEAAVLLGTSVNALADARRHGERPSFLRSGDHGPVRYRLGEVLAVRNEGRFPDLASEVYPSVDVFLAKAAPKEVWPFVLVGRVNRPADLFTALRSVPIEDRHGLSWLTVPAFLEALSVALVQEPEAASADARKARALVVSGSGRSGRERKKS